VINFVKRFTCIKGTQTDSTAIIYL